MALGDPVADGWQTEVRLRFSHGPAIVTMGSTATTNATARGAPPAPVRDPLEYATGLMTSRLIPVAAFDLVVFGATGDLARRKLLPALFHHELNGQLPASVRIIGAARKQMTIEEFRS